MPQRDIVRLAPGSEEAKAIQREAEEHRAAYVRWRHNPGNPQLGIGMLLPQDLGYFADEREHCSHCRKVR